MSKGIKDTVHYSGKRLLLSAQQPIQLHSSLRCSWSNVLIGWNCMWLSQSHYVRIGEAFLFYTLNGELEDLKEQFAEFDNTFIGLELRTAPLNVYWSYILK